MASILAYQGSTANTADTVPAKVCPQLKPLKPVIRVLPLVGFSIFVSVVHASAVRAESVSLMLHGELENLTDYPRGTLRWKCGSKASGMFRK